MGQSSYRLGRPKGNDSLRSALRRVQSLTRSQFNLEPDCTVMAAETECALPDCPPLQTVVVFWSADQTRRHFRVLKSAQDVVCDDLPAAWLEEALSAFERPPGGCC